MIAGENALPAVLHVADLLAAGAGKAQGSVADMSAALNQAGLIAAGTGLSIEDTTGTLAAFASAVYWGIAAERRQNLRAEASQLAAAAATQLPLISHEQQEVGNARKFRNDREVVSLGERRSQRVQWRDPVGRLLQQEGDLALPAWPAAPSAAITEIGRAHV